MNKYNPCKACTTTEEEIHAMAAELGRLQDELEDCDCDNDD